MKHPWHLIVIFVKVLSTRGCAAYILLNSCSKYFEKISKRRKIFVSEAFIATDKFMTDVFPRTLSKTLGKLSSKTALNACF